MRKPSIKEISELLKSIKPYIEDDFKEYEDDEPNIQVTVGFTPEDGSWSYQTGDNSYTGGAYGHPVWGVGWLFRNSNCRELAKDILNEIDDQIYA